MNIGETVHNGVTNKIGMILGCGEYLKVRTISGIEYWLSTDCRIIEDF